MPTLATFCNFTGVIAVVSGVLAVQQETENFAKRVEYTVSIPQPDTQMIDMTMIIHGVDADAIDVALPIWRPGRYVVLDPASTLTEIRATNQDGQALPMEKTSKSIWRIETGGHNNVQVQYRIFANSLGDRTRHVDDTHAFLSGESVFLYVVGQLDRPSLVRFQIPEHWKIASGMDFDSDDDQALFAPDYDVLIDCPIEVGVHEVLKFDVDGTPHEIVIWGQVDYDADRIIEDLRKLVEAQLKMWGKFPYQRYVFLIHAGQGVGGGTEHLNSTIMQTSRAAIGGSRDNNDAYLRFLGLAAHEFFHTWNVKQLRPAGIVPYNYQRENYTKLLWVAEGTTSYYDNLFLARVGAIKPNKYFDGLARAINRYRRRPGRAVQSLEESSFDSWIKYSSRSADRVNSTVSFYSKGALVSLLLDMEMRRAASPDDNLDAALRQMYERFPLEQGGYTPQDLLRTVSTVSNTNLQSFFDAYVRGTQELDFDRALEVVGLELYFKPARKPGAEDNNEETDGVGSTDADSEAETERGSPEQQSDERIPLRASLGIEMSDNTIRSVLADGPAYAGGLMPADEVVAIDGLRLSDRLDDRLKDFEAGDVITITFFRRNRLREQKIKLSGIPDGTWAIRRVSEPTELQKQHYKTWLWQEWPSDETLGED